MPEKFQANSLKTLGEVFKFKVNFSGEAIDILCVYDVRAVNGSDHESSEETRDVCML